MQLELSVSPAPPVSRVLRASSACLVPRVLQALTEQVEPLEPQVLAPLALPGSSVFQELQALLESLVFRVLLVQMVLRELREMLG